MPDSHQFHGHASHARAGQAGQPRAPTPTQKPDPTMTIEEARHFAALQLTTLICDLIERRGAPFSITTAFPVVDAIAHYSNLVAVHELHVDVVSDDVDHGA